MVGVLMARLLGITGVLITRAADIRSAKAAGGLVGLLTVAVLVGNSGLRGELVCLGAGLWLNLAMFGSVAIVYGIATMKVVARFGSEGSSQPVTTRVDARRKLRSKGARNGRASDRGHAAIPGVRFIS
jgi:hypothetical protein